VIQETGDAADAAIGRVLDVVSRLRSETAFERAIRLGVTAKGSPELSASNYFDDYLPNTVKESLAAAQDAVGDGIKIPVDIEGIKNLRTDFSAFFADYIAKAKEFNDIGKGNLEDLKFNERGVAVSPEFLSNEQINLSKNLFEDVIDVLRKLPKESDFFQRSLKSSSDLLADMMGDSIGYWRNKILSALTDAKGQVTTTAASIASTVSNAFNTLRSETAYQRSVRLSVTAKGSPEMAFSDYFSEYVPSVVNDAIAKINGEASKVTIPVGIETAITRTGRAGADDQLSESVSAIVARRTANTQASLDRQQEALNRIAARLRVQNQIAERQLAAQVSTSGSSMATAKTISKGVGPVTIRPAEAVVRRTTGNNSFKLGT
jgi:hypothetical protein